MYFYVLKYSMNKAEIFFQSISPEQLTTNFIHAIGDEWMLITAVSENKFNTMTASWGAAGVLWNKPIAICFVRSTRYTYEFIDKADIFTLSFFNETYRKLLNYCGSNSGRNVDKIKETGLKPIATLHDGITFEQAKLCLECKKIYYDDLKPGNFLIPKTDTAFYPKKDYHRMYIGEIINCLVR